MKKLLAYSLTATLLIGGCSSSKQFPRELEFVPDISASIDPKAQQQMFAAIEDVALHLQRGDTITIIPITGDAEAELQGRTLHYVVPPVEDRQAYDADLRKLNNQIKDDLARLQADAIAHPGKHTDILGSVRIAMREFSGNATDKRLVILSDFIQDDQQFNFDRDPRLRNVSTADSLAQGVSSQIEKGPMVHFFLGRLKSKEFSSLDINRQRAIDSFWEHLLSPARMRPDGPRELLNSL